MTTRHHRRTILFSGVLGQVPAAAYAAKEVTIEPGNDRGQLRLIPEGRLARRPMTDQIGVAWTEIATALVGAAKQMMIGNEGL